MSSEQHEQEPAITDRTCHPAIGDVRRDIGTMFSLVRGSADTEKPFVETAGNYVNIFITSTVYYGLNEHNTEMAQNLSNHMDGKIDVVKISRCSATKIVLDILKSAIHSTTPKTDIVPINREETEMFDTNLGNAVDELEKQNKLISINRISLLRSLDNYTRQPMQSMLANLVKTAYLDLEEQNQLAKEITTGTITTLAELRTAVAYNLNKALPQRTL